VSNVLMELHGLTKKTIKPKNEVISPEILLERMDFLEIAKGIVKAHKLKSKVVFIRKGKDKGDYIPETDTMEIETTSDFEDFLFTVLHECHHALMAKRYGAKKFMKMYTQAGTMAVYHELDPHDDNKWEKKADKYAERSIKGWLSKLKKPN